jgi:hypothetical protein
MQIQETVGIPSTSLDLNGLANWVEVMATANIHPTTNFY